MARPREGLPDPLRGLPAEWVRLDEASRQLAKLLEDPDLPMDTIHDLIEELRPVSIALLMKIRCIDGRLAEFRSSGSLPEHQGQGSSAE